MKLKFSKKFEQFMILHNISRFFELDCWAFLVKVCILNQLQLQQSHLVLSKNEIHQLVPYIFKRQP